MSTTNAHILIVDDDRRIRELLQQYLVDEGYFVTTASDAEEAREKLTQFAFDLLVVDVMMPGENGMELTASLQGKIEAPILMLTAMSEVEDRISGLESGADDYLGKPFEPKELSLRIRKLIARTRPVKPENHLLYFGDYTLDAKRSALSHHGTPIELTSKESAALIALVSNAGKQISRDELAKICGGINGRSVDVLITRIRNKIETNPKNPVFLKTVWGKGYIFHA